MRNAVADRVAPPTKCSGGARRKPVVVVDYDPAWPTQFRSLRGRIAGVLRLMASAIEHVGSTAVPGLAAKPIIDIDVLLSAESLLPAAIARLATLGYIHQGDLGIPGREAFLSPTGSTPHHLYLCPPHSAELRRHLALRNYLRNHPEEARKYGDLKKALALRFADDRAAYQAGKSEFVVELTKRAIAGLGRSSEINGGM
jgi:GrpB-like predicted nucleotidyltransferase (UPF0157 family)